MSRRAKFAFITWIGPGVSPLKKAKVSTDKAFIKDLWPVSATPTAGLRYAGVSARALSARASIFDTFQSLSLSHTHTHIYRTLGRKFWLMTRTTLNTTSS